MVGLAVQAGAEIEFVGIRTAAAATVSGASIPPEVSRVGRGRYRSKRDWDRTLRFFRGVYGRKQGIIWKRLDTPPRVKAIHIANTRARRRWDGINIYESEGKVTIVVLPAERSSQGRGRK